MLLTSMVETLIVCVEVALAPSVNVIVAALADRASTSNDKFWVFCAL